MIKKVFLICIAFALLSFSQDSYLKKGDSIVDSRILVANEINHSFVICYANDFSKFGFVDKRRLSLEIAIVPQFDNVYKFETCEGCLVWVEKNGKWGVLDIDTYETDSIEFIYDAPSEFKEVSYDKNTNKARYEAKAKINGKTTKVSVEKYTCITYYKH